MKTLHLGLLLLFAVGCAMGQDRKLVPIDGLDLSPADLERVRVGTPAPDFALESKDGTLVALSNFKGKENVILVFYRGYW